MGRSVGMARPPRHWPCLLGMVVVSAALTVVSAGEVYELQDDYTTINDGVAAPVKSCLGSCSGACTGVVMAQSYSCRPMLGEGATAKQLQTMHASLQAAEMRSCMSQCKGRGAMCKGIYISRADSACPMILTKQSPQLPAGMSLNKGAGPLVS